MVATPNDNQWFLTLELTGLGRLGEALSEVDGKPVYVFGGIPGETVVAEVIRERRGYFAAEVVEVLKPSPHRVEPPCPYFGACTGCQFQHISYERQLEMKREAVVDALVRIGELDGAVVGETLPSPEPLGYRNHARFTISKPEPRPGRIGYVHREKRQHVEVDRCLLMADWINEAVEKLQGNVAETTQLSLRYGVNTGDWLLQPTFSEVGVPMASGQKHYKEELLGHTFQVSSPSFFQVNTHQAERMMTRVIEALELTGEETIVDAYAGVATFAVLLADHVKRAIAVEESASALIDARVNVAGIANVELRQARTEDVLAELVADGVDAIILDPPRTGCMPGTIDALLDSPPRRIVYVSCEPETLARDLALLTAGPFTLDSVTPVDMFPQTQHVESVSILTFDPERHAQLQARSQLVLASASPRRHEIVSRLGLEVDVAPNDVEEPAARPDQEPQDVAVERALIKARASVALRESGTIVGADTVVELDGEVLGKPLDADDAWRMLRALRNREHRVITGVALIDAATGDERTAFRATRVIMRDYSDDEIESYIASGDPFDKAGAYAVQHEGFSPAAEVRGCYLNVVGLPVCTLLKEAERFGLRITPKPDLPWPELSLCPECAKRAGAPVPKRMRGG
ncbi:MAG: Maf family nucleotide pyrophosphatase [Chloroflexi bacterium]|nr:Maf family nucleotide pyrophosphatase [Chloroflexota bacterium]MDA1173454.1 Maf family nucleotide pyrophosphatase [Chloroflexota bacterium]